MNFHSIFLNSQKNYAVANVETSNKCTLRCPQCARQRLYLPKDTRDYREIKTIIDSGSDLTLENAEKLLKFFSNGLILCGQISDPVYWKYIKDFLSLSQNFPKTYIGIHTSASQKNIEWYLSAFKLCHKLITWKFGIDGFEDTSPIYRKNQNTKLLFEAMLLGKSMNINVEWHYIVFEHNEHQIEQATSFAKIHDIPLYLIKSNRKGGGVIIPEKWQTKRNKEIIHVK
jgi:hypothetical protein